LPARRSSSHTLCWPILETTCIAFKFCQACHLTICSRRTSAWPREGEPTLKASSWLSAHLWLTKIAGGCPPSARVRPASCNCTDETSTDGQDGNKHAHAGSRTRVTSMGGLYETATLHALCSLGEAVALKEGDRSFSD